jgi:hypothetical protein
LKRWQSVVAEVAGLFVDDGPFAAAIVVWIGLIALGLHVGGGFRPWLGLLLFAGLSINLIASVVKASKQQL